MTRDQALNWLSECKKYFEKICTETQEDYTFWAMMKNQEMLDQIIQYIIKLDMEIKTLTEL